MLSKFGVQVLPTFARNPVISMTLHRNFNESGNPLILPLISQQFSQEETPTIAIVPNNCSNLTNCSQIIASSFFGNIFPDVLEPEILR